MIVVFLAVGWFFGLWASSIAGLSSAQWFLITAAFSCVAFIRRRQRIESVSCLVLCFAGLAGARFAAASPTFGPSTIAFFNGSRQTTFVGIVDAAPDIRDGTIFLRLRAETVSLDQIGEIPVTGMVMVQTHRFPVIPYGSRVELNGSLEAPEAIDDFDYEAYLARQNIFSQMKFPEITVLATGKGHPLRAALIDLRARTHLTIDRLIPEPQAALLAGILLGDDSGLSSDLSEAFQETGLTHIIAISGFNIAIFMGVLLRLGDPFLSRRGAAYFAVSGVALYTVLVGAEASVVRAAVMGAIYVFSSRMLGRPTFPFASLAVAGFIMTLIDPMVFWDVGFQLSFAATLGLMLYAEPLTHWVQRQLERGLDKNLLRPVMTLLSDAVLVTISAQILTIPLMIAYFKESSLISLVANAFVLPAQPGVMIWGGLTALIGAIFAPLGKLTGYVAWLFLAYTTEMVEMFAGIQDAVVPINSQTWAILAAYGLIGGLTWLGLLHYEKRTALWVWLRQRLDSRVVLSSAALIFALVAAWALTQPDGRLHVLFLDVGQGDAVFIQTPSGRQILVDGGYYPSVLNEKLGREMPFWDRDIDIIFATHADADHISGLPDLFQRYQVARLVTNGEDRGVSEIYDAMITAAETSRTIIRPAVAGEQITVGDGVILEMLHPNGQLFDDNRNNNSICLRLTYGEFSLLLTGDAEEKAEQLILAERQPLSATVLKAGHHGSKSSSTVPFLEAVQPQIVVISVGESNRYSHPSPELLQRVSAVGAEVLRTDELGTIEVISDGQQIWWQAVP